MYRNSFPEDDAHRDQAAEPAGQPMKIGRCAHGTYHLHVGSLSLRLSPTELETAASLLVACMRRHPSDFAPARGRLG